LSTFSSRHAHPRHQHILREGAHAVADHALFLGQIAFEVERILPVELAVFQHGRRLLRGSFGGLRHGELPAYNLFDTCLYPIAYRDCRPRESGDDTEFDARFLVLAARFRPRIEGVAPSAEIRGGAVFRGLLRETPGGRTVSGSLSLMRS
jgi:hypothetical protein